MTNREKAREVVAQAGGDENECLDWLNDGDGAVMELDELVVEWVACGCEYSA